MENKLEQIVQYFMQLGYNYKQAYDEAVAIEKYNLNQDVLCQN